MFSALSKGTRNMTLLQQSKDTPFLSSRDEVKTEGISNLIKHAKTNYRGS